MCFLNRCEETFGRRCEKIKILEVTVNVSFTDAYNFKASNTTEIIKEAVNVIVRDESLATSPKYII